MAFLGLFGKRKKNPEQERALSELIGIMKDCEKEVNECEDKLSKVIMVLSGGVLNEAMWVELASIENSIVACHSRSKQMESGVKVLFASDAKECKTVVDLSDSFSASVWRAYDSVKLVLALRRYVPGQRSIEQVVEYLNLAVDDLKAAKKALNEIRKKVM